MGYKVKVKPHTRRRPATPRMQELFDRLGIKPEVSVGSHERAYTRRRVKRKEDQEDPEDGEES